MRTIQPLIDALKIHAKHYKSFGDYSVTQLIDAPRRVRLMKRFEEFLAPPPESQIASFVGTGVHAYFENCLKQYTVADSRYEIERSVTEHIADRLITGRFDILYDKTTMYDIKTCKVWKLIFDPNKEEWTQQQNLYAYLLHRRGIDVKSLNIIAVYMDWIESQAVRDKNYPREAVENYELELWPFDYTDAYLNERLALHKACENLSNEALPECSREERWERHEGGVPIRYAVLKTRKAARATRVFDTLDEAVEYFKTAGSKLNSQSCIEIRYAQPKRCMKYCAVNQFCNWYINYTGKVNSETVNDYFTFDQIHKGEIY